MLPGSTLNARAADSKTVYLRLGSNFSPLVKVVLDIAVSCLIRNRTNSSRLENVVLAEQLLGVFVSKGLIFTRKVKVNIGSLVSVKSQKRFKWNIVSVAVIGCTAFLTVFRRKIISRTNRTVRNKNAVLTVGTDIMGRKRIYRLSGLYS